MISVRSVSGAWVTVEVVEGGRLTLTVSCGGGEMTSTTRPLPHDLFTAVVSQQNGQFLSTLGIYICLRQ